ncbi:MAG: four helix bundle protein [Verrucomicrobia bacterium]|nr:four helix bundle protein [Verrucomicrobiota bacterium]
MSTGKRFEDLDVWKLAKDVVLTVYDLTSRAPVSRDYGFKDQIQRASVSIMSNIAEGFERRGNREFIYFLYIAKGSAGEVRSLAHVGAGLGYIPPMEQSVLMEKISSVSRQLAGFIGYLERDLAARTKSTPP